jgi:hypothetical protein
MYMWPHWDIMGIYMILLGYNGDIYGLIGI